MRRKGQPQHQVYSSVDGGGKDVYDALLRDGFAVLSLHKSPFQTPIPREQWPWLAREYVLNSLRAAPEFTLPTDESDFPQIGLGTQFVPAASSQHSPVARELRSWIYEHLAVIFQYEKRFFEMGAGSITANPPGVRSRLNTASSCRGTPLEDNDSCFFGFLNLDRYPRLLYRRVGGDVECVRVPSGCCVIMTSSTTFDCKTPGNARRSGYLLYNFWCRCTDNCLSARHPKLDALIATQGVISGDPQESFPGYSDKVQLRRPETIVQHADGMIPRCKEHFLRNVLGSFPSLRDIGCQYRPYSQHECLMLHPHVLVPRFDSCEALKNNSSTTEATEATEFMEAMEVTLPRMTPLEVFETRVLDEFYDSSSHSATWQSPTSNVDIFDIDNDIFDIDNDSKKRCFETVSKELPSKKPSKKPRKATLIRQ